MEAMNQDESKVLKLLAIVNGVIKFRFHDLQMFIHLIGKPGSGKGTFSRLLEKIVGKENHKSSRLEKLGDDYEVAKIIDSQLVICPDEDKQVGNMAD
jgi:putative DNA primase/helicase